MPYSKRKRGGIPHGDPISEQEGHGDEDGRMAGWQDGRMAGRQDGMGCGASLLLRVVVRATETHSAKPDISLCCTCGLREHLDVVEVLWVDRRVVDGWVEPRHSDDDISTTSARVRECEHHRFVIVGRHKSCGE